MNKIKEYFLFHLRKINFQVYKKPLAFLLVFAVVALATAVFFKKNDLLKQFGLTPTYAEAFVLVNDQISEGADIVINIPKALAVAEMIGNIRFEPSVRGDWLKSVNKKQLIFRPAENLLLGNHYLVIASTSKGMIKKDFLVVEKPRVVSVFPNANEASAESDITVIFNRPMVPLTAIDVLADKDIPVEIAPITKGRFKWIGTRTLQFSPETALISSANYKVKIKSDFVSVDGLRINEFEHSFITKPLRYENFSEGTVLADKPFFIRFNQAVDLDKTKQEISLLLSLTGDKIAFVCEYGSKNIYNQEIKKWEQIVDESVLEIYQAKDKYQRVKKWDFKNAYDLTINKAYPKNGDINLEEIQMIHFSATDVVENFSVNSPRSIVSAFAVFDPMGALVVDFYEEVDLAKSKISADKIGQIKYGEKCKNTDDDINNSPDCEKIDNKKKVLVAFDSQKIGKGESLKVVLEKIVNVEGLTINPEAITKELKSYGDLKITKSIPDKDFDFVICSNNPLAQPAEEDVNRKNIAKYIEANLDFEIVSWEYSYRVDESVYQNEKKCTVGEFQTNLRLRFVPETDYQLTFKLLDQFGQERDHQSSFRSLALPDQSLLFFHYQPKYNMTTPTKTKLVYATQNMEYVDVNICKLDGKDMLFYLDKGIDYYNGPNVVKNCQESIDKKIFLPKKYWIKNYLSLELKDYISDPLGHYLLTFTNKDYRDWEKRQVYERTYLTVTNLSVVEKNIQIENYKDSDDDYKITNRQLDKLKNIYWVTDLKNFAPVDKASLDFFGINNDGDDMLKLGSVLSNDKGLAEATPINRMVGVVVKSGDDSALVFNDSGKFEYASTAYNAQMIYLYTDRPIYKPEQTVNFKGIYRIGYDGDYEVFNKKKMPVKVFDAANKEIFNKELTVNEFGTFNGEFVLPKDVSLGQFRIEAKESSSVYFDVEEYVGSAFKLETSTDKDEYISGETFNLNIDASYYFGAPVEDGTIEYSIASQDYYFDKYQDEYFDFGSNWYSCYDCGFGDHFIMRNQDKLDTKGKGKISQNINIGKIFQKDEQRSKIIVVYITVKNANGQAVSTQKSFIYHAGQYYLGLNADKSFVGKNEKFNLKLKSVNVSSKALSVDDIKLKLNKINWVYNKRQEVDGAFYYNWEKKTGVIVEKTIATNDKGDWLGDFSFDKEGEYEAVVSGVDKLGNNIQTVYSLYVYGAGQADVRPSNDTSLEVIADKGNLEVGEEGKIIIKSPFPKAKAMISIERGKIYNYEIVDIEQNIFEYKFPILENYTPLVYASVVLLSPDPEIKYGNVDFRVNSDVKKIAITSKLNKSVYLPGDEVVLELYTKDARGKAIVAEVSTAVADLSVLALKGNPKKNPLAYFYDYFPLTVLTASNIKNVLYEADVFLGGKGGGGAEPEDLAKKKRGVFKDTAFWQADIKTNEQGYAQVKFTLPDNLTTWQLESLGVSQDTKLGAEYKEFMAKKEIMVAPLKPRFILPGDEFFVGAQVFNQSKEDQDLEISFTSATLSGSDKVAEKIKAGESKNIYFATSITNDITVGEVQFVVAARNNQYDDTVESTVRVNVNNTYETVATADNTKSNNAYEYVYIPNTVIGDKGGLRVNTSASLAQYSQTALKYLLEYPYGCSEQIASKLKAIAIVKQSADLKKEALPLIDYNDKKYNIVDAVNLALGDLQKNYQTGQGFSYYLNGSADFYLTLHITDALMSLQKSGLMKNDKGLSFADLSKIIQNKLLNDPYLTKNKDANILAFYILTELRAYQAINPVIVDRIARLKTDKKFLNEEADNLSLLKLAEILSRNLNLFDNSYRDDYKNEIYKILESRIVIDSRGAFLPVRKNTNWQAYENNIKDTALFLKAMTTDKRESKILGNVARWLLQSRDKDGAWGSTNNTLAVVEAFDDYVLWQEENKSDFTLDILVNNDKKAQIAYNAQNLYKAENTLFMPINELATDYLNVINFVKKNNNQAQNNFYYDMALQYYLPVENISPRDEGFYIDRNFYLRDDDDDETKISEAKIGDVLRGHIEIVVPNDRAYVAIEDFIPAGVELVNFNLATADQSLRQGFDQNETEVPARIGKSEIIYPDKLELRDDRLFMFVENLKAGSYVYDYYVRVLIPGKFLHLPARISEMYFPENFGRSKAGYFQVQK